MNASNPSVPPFLRAYPPWYARTTGWIIITMAAAAAVFALSVELPIALDSRFTVLEHSRCADSSTADCPAVLVGEMYLPQSAFAEVSPGQAVTLYYDALPKQRWGARSGTLSFVASTVTEGRLLVRFEVERLVVHTADGERSIGPGATGMARIIFGRHSFFERALLPLQSMRARWPGQASEPGGRP